ncbi:hypothetical protein BHE74_00022961 [Ensete ventricosum]|nr:hypothetical protein GW17_00010534 [Ensete ventricosum]RWW69438.1 hypothetical protein BHE74_00022961 [Ensete ventricosum]RZS03739.1 hypothetical protein BHM03_00033951 [Ensete ventricosum]
MIFLLCMFGCMLTSIFSEGRVVNFEDQRNCNLLSTAILFLEFFSDLVSSAFRKLTGSWELLQFMTQVITTMLLVTVRIAVWLCRCISYRDTREMD